MHAKVSCLSLLLLFLSINCAGTLPSIRDVVVESSAAPKPEWTSQSIKQEGKFIFATGSSKAMPTEQEAKDEALARATEEIVRYSGVTVDAFSRSVEASSEVQGKEYYTADFETKRKIRAKAFVRRATPIEWYMQKIARMQGNEKIGESYSAFVYVKVSEEEIERIQTEKDVKLSLDIGMYYEDENGKLEYLAEGRVLHSGDAYALYIRPTTNCFLYVVQADDMGHLYRLFPNATYQAGTNPLNAGEDYWVPNTEKYFVLDETTGKERFYVFASPAGIPELEGSSELQLAEVERIVKTMGVAGMKEKVRSYTAAPPKRVQIAEVKKKLQAEGAFVYETWFWHR